MTRVLSTGLALLLAALCAPDKADAVVINFNATTADDYLFADYSEGGYLFTTVAGHHDFFGPAQCNLISGICTDNFLNVDDSVYGPSTVRVTQVGGGSFDLFSFNVLDVYDYNQQTYQFSACGLGCQVRSSRGAVVALTSGLMEFSADEWRAVDWIEFYTASPGAPTRVASTAIDNISVAPSAVPAPPALGLLGLGIVSLAARRVAAGRARP